MRVIDASALLKYIFREDGWSVVNDLLLEGCIAPELILKECANGLWRRVLKGDITRDFASKVLDRLIHEEIVKVVPQAGLLPKALEIAADRKTTVYDALYIVLAKEKGIELITSDEQQDEVAKTVGIRPILVR